MVFFHIFLVAFFIFCLFGFIAALSYQSFRLLKSFFNKLKTRYNENFKTTLRY